MSDTLILLPGDDITDIIDAQTKEAAMAPPMDTNAAKSGKFGTKSGAKASAPTTADPSAPKLMIGPGLKREANHRFVAVKCGQLVTRHPTPAIRSCWIDSRHKRYVTSRGDRVIGFVVSKQAYQCKVDIGTNEPGILSLLAFPQATKRNKPTIEVGDAVYTQITTECPDIEPELVCVDSNGKSSGLGVLSSTGYVLTVPINIVRRLLSPDSQVIKTLGSKYKFEITCGMNGRVWINARSLDTTLSIVNFIESLEHIPKCQYQHVCQQLVHGFERIERH